MSPGPSLGYASHVAPPGVFCGQAACAPVHPHVRTHTHAPAHCPLAHAASTRSLTHAKPPHLSWDTHSLAHCVHVCVHSHPAPAHASQRPACPALGPMVLLGGHPVCLFLSPSRPGEVVTLSPSPTLSVCPSPQLPPTERRGHRVGASLYSPPPQAVRHSASCSQPAHPPAPGPGHARRPPPDHLFPPSCCPLTLPHVTLGR